MAEGQTATNPQTGERVVLRGGQWVPLTSASPRQQRQPRQQPRYQGPMPANADEVFGSLIAQESGGRVGVRGPDTQYGNALGRTQVLPSTARGIARNLGIPYREDLLTGTTPEAAAYQDTLGRAYLEEGFRNTGNARDALMYYHGGPDRSLWGPKTNAYADEVLSRWSQGGGVAPVDGVQAPAQGASIQEGATATNPETGERVTFSGGQWVPVQPQEVVVDQGVQNVNGRAVVAGVDQGPWEEYWAGQRRSQSDRQARAEREASPEYQAAMRDAQAGAAAVPDRLRALGLGGTLGFLTDINAEAQRGIQAVENAGRRIAGQEIEYGADMAAQAARDAMRNAQRRYEAENPVENFALQFAGGLASPASLVGGQYISGARGADAIRRAGQVGFATGAASGVGYGEGNIAERAPGAAVGGVAGAGLGAVAQGVINRIPATGQGGGAARRLSRAGVDLTPGQMVSEVPVAGQFIRNLEDVAGGFNPLMAGVRRAQNEQVIRAAGNEALASIGETLPKNTRTGYQVAQRVSKALGDRYDDVTSGIAAQADAPFYSELDGVMTRAGTVLDDANFARLDRILKDKVYRELDDTDVLTGPNFKRIETALREQSERASRPTSTLADNDLAEMIDEVRDMTRNLIARQYPEAAEEISNLNRGWANYKRIERAVSGSAGFSREGTPTPGELSQTVANMSSGSQIANERALLQGLATDARTVLPSTVPDSGSAQKVALASAAGALGTGGVALINPGLAGLIGTGAVVYSRPGIMALNALYRATDSQAANVAVRELADQARRNPALQPYYQAALEYARGLSQPDTPGTQPVPAPNTATSPQLQRVLQQ